jgi:hypothetical protein
VPLPVTVLPQGSISLVTILELLCCWELLLGATLELDGIALLLLGVALELLSVTLELLGTTLLLLGATPELLLGAATLLEEG